MAQVKKYARLSGLNQQSYIWDFTQLDMDEIFIPTYDELRTHIGWHINPAYWPTEPEHWTGERSVIIFSGYSHLQEGELKQELDQAIITRTLRGHKLQDNTVIIIDPINPEYYHV